MITPEIWGPHGWKFMHYVTLGYPLYPTNDDKDHYKKFFTLIQYVLPCSLCAHHYRDNLLKLPLSDEILSSKDNLIKWCIDMHNIVNESKNKPILSYQDAFNKINDNTECKAPIQTIYKSNANDHANDHANDDNSTMYYLLTILFILILIALVYKKR